MRDETLHSAFKAIPGEPKEKNLEYDISCLEVSCSIYLHCTVSENNLTSPTGRLEFAEGFGEVFENVPFVLCEEGV